MHEVFQRDLLRLKLETTRSYFKAISSSLTPVITSQNTSLKITAQVCACVFEMFGLNEEREGGCVYHHFLYYIRGGKEVGTEYVLASALGPLVLGGPGNLRPSRNDSGLKWSASVS
jgi:hypothetical protein